MQLLKNETNIRENLWKVHCKVKRSRLVWKNFYAYLRWSMIGVQNLLFPIDFDFLSIRTNKNNLNQGFLWIILKCPTNLFLPRASENPLITQFVCQFLSIDSLEMVGMDIQIHFEMIEKFLFDFYFFFD